MKLIGYDFDGVFVPDTHLQDLKGKALNSALEWRTKRMCALFVPEGEYVIVTGRPKQDKPMTMKWIKRELAGNPPKAVFHDNKHQDLAIDYKISVLLNNDIELLVESSPVQAEAIQAASFVPCVVFADLIRTGVKREIQNIRYLRFNDEN